MVGGEFRLMVSGEFRLMLVGEALPAFLLSHTLRLAFLQASDSSIGLSEQPFGWDGLCPWRLQWKQKPSYLTIPEKALDLGDLLSKPGGGLVGFLSKPGGGPVGFLTSILAGEVRYSSSNSSYTPQ